MATQRLAVIADASGESRLEADVDGSDLILARVVNGLSRPVFVLCQRSSGQTWFTDTVPAGETSSQNAGGPVKRLSDITYTLLTTT